jgi:E3 ubiquitin-protein ligase UBR4
MQKKSVLLLTAGGVIRCADVVSQPMRDSQFLHLSRLLLLLEYLMKHLYDAPPALLEQVIRLQTIPVLRVNNFKE